MPGRLIVHAGAHKTGTTTTQLFLHYYHVWIRDTFDIHIVPNGKWVNHCSSAECADVLVVAGLLRQNRTVLISSELFGATTEPSQTFWSLHKLFAPLAELTVVMVHRHTMDWLASMWAQSSKQVPGAGQQVQVGESFAAFLTRQAYGKYQPQRQAYAKPRLDGQERTAESFAQPQDFTRGLPRSSFDGFTRLARLVGPKRVQVVSANRLWDENRTVTSFLICNASLGLVGPSWTRCARDVSSREETIPKANVSPRPVMVDVLRLARLLYLSECGSAQASNASAVLLAPHGTKSLEGMEKACASLPQTCVGTNGKDTALAVLSQQFDTKFLQDVGAKLPDDLWPKPLCIIDEARLEIQHVQTIRSFLPPCPRTGSSSTWLKWLLGY